MGGSVSRDPVHPRNDRACRSVTTGIESLDGVNRHAVCCTVNRRSDFPGHERAVPIVILSAVPIRGGPVADTSCEMGVGEVDSAVEHINVDTGAPTRGSVFSVQWQVPLVNPIKAPAAGNAGSLDLTAGRLTGHERLLDVIGERNHRVTFHSCHPSGLLQAYGLGR